MPVTSHDGAPQDWVPQALTVTPADIVSAGETAPAPANPEDIDGLLVEVDYYENRPCLGRLEFERYVEAESALENIVSAEATLRQKEFEYQHADELLARVIELNTRQREIARREAARTDPTPDADYLSRLEYISGAADGVILLMEGLRFANIADHRRLASDFEAADENLKSAMDYFARLAESDLPLSSVGALRYTLTGATAQLMQGLQQMRGGDYRGAYASLDKTHVTFRELLAQAEEEHQRDGGQSDPQFDELQRDLSDGLRYVQAIQGFVEMLREAQDGNYADAVHSGEEAVDRFVRILKENIARQVNRNARSLYEMELARVQGWLSWARAELAVDECRWTECREQIRQARGYWNEATRIATRNVFVGIMAQPPEAGNTEMLLKNTLRRCDREVGFRRQIRALEVTLDRAGKIEILAQGGNAVSASSDYNFHGNVAAQAIGNQNTVRDGQITQNIGAPDLKELAGQLAELREVMAGAARSPQEHEAVTAVVAASEAAGRNDEQGVRLHLVRAGQWALRIAEQLALTAVTTAIKASMGG
jgi:hypothetical protein